MLHLLNQNAGREGLDQTTREDFVRKFPEVGKKIEGSMNVTVSCHCELIVVLHMAKISASKQIEIGVSEGLCFLCETFLKIFTLETQIRINISRFQGEIHSGWMMPPQASNLMKGKMQKWINNEINDVRESVIARRRSDSFPAADYSVTNGMMGLTDNW